MQCGFFSWQWWWMERESVASSECHGFSCQFLSTTLCAALTLPPVQCSDYLSNVSVSLFSSFDFYTFSCTFVVIVNVLGFCCFSLFLQSEEKALSFSNFFFFKTDSWRFLTLIITLSLVHSGLWKKKYYSGDVSYIYIDSADSFLCIIWFILQCDVLEQLLVSNLNYTNFLLPLFCSCVRCIDYMICVLTVKYTSFITQISKVKGLF